MNFESSIDSKIYFYIRQFHLAGFTTSGEFVNLTLASAVDNTLATNKNIPVFISTDRALVACGNVSVMCRPV